MIVFRIAYLVFRFIYDIRYTKYDRYTNFIDKPQTLL